MNALVDIERAAREQRLDYAHYALARLVQESIAGASDFCLWTLVLVSSELARGHVCVDLNGLTQGLQELGFGHDKDLSQQLTNSPVIGGPLDARPLVWDQQRLYLNRYFHNEARISERLLQLASLTDDLPSTTIDTINELFSASAADDRQRLAAIVSCRQRLAVISGGPGTGKTWTVSRILRLLSQREPDLQVMLAAPTGKAAARINQSMLAAADASAVHTTAITLHRLLGIHRYSQRPRFHAANPLNCDVLVVDEASMIDQRMMSMLLDALPLSARLILLGDRDQLSSVEAGSVFADLCGSLDDEGFSAQQVAWLQHHWPGLEARVSASTYRLRDQVVVLTQSRRFDAASPIGRLARATNNSDGDACMAVLRGSQDERLLWGQPEADRLHIGLIDQARRYYRDVIEAGSLQQAMDRFERFRILSPLWRGPSGVDAVNDAIENFLKRESGVAPAQQFYRGRAIMLTRNLPQAGVFNGDSGLIWPDDDGHLRAFFALGGGAYRRLSLSQVTDAHSAWAITVHKSQGSEFERVLMLLPDEDSPVLTRELLYTGVTRAAQSLELWGREEIIRATIQRRTRRMSGLPGRLSR